MQILSRQNFQSQTSQTEIKIKNLYTEKLTKDETKALRQQVVDNANTFTFKSTSTQMNLGSNDDKFKKDYEDFQLFLKSVSYKGKAIASLSQDEAKILINENGIFGVKQTSQRIADFVINGANKNIDLLRAGREGILKGFELAQDMWGSELPELSQKTIQASIALVDSALKDAGATILDTKV